MRKAIFATVGIFLLYLTNTVQADNRLLELKLNKEQGTASALASCKTFLENEMFSHPDFSGYVIKISGDNTIFDGIPKDKIIEVIGPYRIDSRGFAPHLYISDVELVQDQKIVRDQKPVDTNIIGGLPKGDELRKASSEIDTEWNDGNITTGTSRLASGKLTQEVNLDTKLNRQLFVATAANYIGKLNGKLLKNLRILASGSYQKNHRALAAGILAEANAYAPENKEGLKEFEDNLQKMLGLLGTPKSLMTFAAQAKIANNGDADDLRKVSVVTFLNKDTGKFISVFAIEGTM